MCDNGLQLCCVKNKVREDRWRRFHTCLETEDFRGMSACTPSRRGGLPQVWLLSGLAFVPNGELFQYTGATVVAMPTGAAACLRGMRHPGRQRRSR